MVIPKPAMPCESGLSPSMSGWWVPSSVVVSGTYLSRRGGSSRITTSFAATAPPFVAVISIIARSPHPGHLHRRSVR